jgi:hypothetical protein
MVPRYGSLGHRRGAAACAVWACWWHRRGVAAACFWTDRVNTSTNGEPFRRCVFCASPLLRNEFLTARLLHRDLPGAVILAYARWYRGAVRAACERTGRPDSKLRTRACTQRVSVATWICQRVCRHIFSAAVYLAAAHKTQGARLTAGQSRCSQADEGVACSPYAAHGLCCGEQQR